MFEFINFPIQLKTLSKRTVDFSKNVDLSKKPKVNYIFYIIITWFNF